MEKLEDIREVGKLIDETEASGVPPDIIKKLRTWHKKEAEKVLRKHLSIDRSREILKQQGMTDTEIDDCIKGIKKGMRAFREGRFKAWAHVKKELGIKD